MEKDSIIVSSEYNGMRLDKYLSIAYNELSRTFIQKLILDGNILVNNKIVKSGYRLVNKDTIDINFPEPEILLVEPENIQLDIIFEDEDIIIINKPKGLVVHPSFGHLSGTLVNALMYHCKDNLSSINGILRPGIVHRIDMNTTGAIVVCKNNHSHQALADQLKVHSITRKYNALVYNGFKDMNGTVDAPIGRHNIDRKKMSINYKNGKNAITHYKVIEQFSNKYAHIECMLETGRTHQIRVHMASINHPIIGDNVYGIKKDDFNLEGQTLHARVLGFIHPSSNSYVEFEAPIPNYFLELEEKLRNK